MIGTWRAVVLDAPDARRLAAFYTALGGWAEQYADDDWITMETGDGWRIAAQRSPGHLPPRWPDLAGLGRRRDRVCRSGEALGYRSGLSAAAIA